MSRVTLVNILKKCYNRCMAIKEVYAPNPFEQYQALQGGIRYVAGVAILHKPEEMEDFYGGEPTDNLQEAVVQRAKGLIAAGLGQIIKCCNSPDLRSLAKMGGRFAEASLHIRTISSELYEVEGRVEKHFPCILAFRPMPILKESIYKRFCHGNLGTSKLTLASLMDDVPIDESLLPYCRLSS